MGASFAKDWRQAGVTAALTLLASMPLAIEVESGPIRQAIAGTSMDTNGYDQAATSALPSEPQMDKEEKPVIVGSPNKQSQSEHIRGKRTGGAEADASTDKQGDRKNCYIEWLCCVLLPLVVVVIYLVWIAGKKSGLAVRERVLPIIAIVSWGVAMIVILLGGIRPFIFSSAGADAKDVLSMMGGGLSFLLGLIAYVRWQDKEQFDAAKGKLSEDLDRQINDAQKKLEERLREIEQDVRERVNLAIIEMSETASRFHSRQK